MRHVVHGLVRLAEREVTGIVNIGTGAPVTLKEIAAAVVEAVGFESAVVVEPPPDVDPPATFADTTRCRQLLGFVPRTDLAALVHRQLRAQVDSEYQLAAAVTA